jgi:hypothetical protein
MDSFHVNLLDWTLHVYIFLGNIGVAFYFIWKFQHLGAISGDLRQ